MLVTATSVFRCALHALRGLFIHAVELGTARIVVTTTRRSSAATDEAKKPGGGRASSQLQTRCFLIGLNSDASRNTAVSGWHQHNIYLAQFELHGQQIPWLNRCKEAGTLLPILSYF